MCRLSFIFFFLLFSPVLVCKTRFRRSVKKVMIRCLFLLGGMLNLIVLSFGVIVLGAAYGLLENTSIELTVTLIIHFLRVNYIYLPLVQFPLVMAFSLKLSPNNEPV